jgi:ankyrin repeat protein
MDAFYKNAWDEELINAAIISDSSALYAALEGGADPDAKCCEGTHKGKTGLMIMAGQDFDTGVSIFVTNNATIDLTDKFGNTALIFGAANAFPGIIRSLLEAKADPNHQNATGYTPLMHAAMYGKVENCRLLLDAGADITLTSMGAEGKTAIECAAGMGKRDVLTVLLKEVDDRNLHKEMVPHIEKALELAQKEKNKRVETQLYLWLESYQITHIRVEQQRENNRKQQRLRNYLGRGPRK